MDGEALAHEQLVQVELAARQAEAQQLQAEVLAQHPDGANTPPVLDIEQAAESRHLIELSPHSCPADCPQHNHHELHEPNHHVHTENEYGQHGHETHTEPPRAEIHLAPEAAKPHTHAHEHEHGHEKHGAIIHPPDCVCPDHAPQTHAHEQEHHLHEHEHGSELKHQPDIKLAHDCTGPDCCRPDQAPVPIIEQIVADQHEKAVATATVLKQAEAAASLPRAEASSSRANVDNRPPKPQKKAEAPPSVFVAQEKPARDPIFPMPKTAEAPVEKIAAHTEATTSAEVGETFVGEVMSAVAAAASIEEFTPLPEEPVVLEISGETRAAQVVGPAEISAVPQLEAEMTLPDPQAVESNSETLAVAPLAPMEETPTLDSEMPLPAAERTVIETPPRAETGHTVAAAVQITEYIKATAKPEIAAQVVAEIRAYMHATEAGEGDVPDAPHQFLAEARAALVRAGLHDAALQLDAFAAQHGDATSLSLLLQAIEIPHSRGAAQIQPAKGATTATTIKPQTFLGTIALSLLRLAGQLSALPAQLARAS